MDEMPTTTPQQIAIDANTDGQGYREREGYVMPIRDEHDHWSAITSYPEQDNLVECPVEGCSQHLLWYEAGYVPGYRVCMAPTEEGRYDHGSILHRFTMHHDRAHEYDGVVLILED